jgi:hypothetical protein
MAADVAMTTITLPTDIEQPLAEAARKNGTTPEQLAVESLRKLFVPLVPPADKGAKPTLYDLLGDYIGSVVGSGVAYSERCGERFAEAMVEKRQRGKL